MYGPNWRPVNGARRPSPSRFRITTSVHVPGGGLYRRNARGADRYRGRQEFDTTEPAWRQTQDADLQGRPFGDIADHACPGIVATGGDQHPTSGPHRARGRRGP